MARVRDQHPAFAERFSGGHRAALDVPGDDRQASVAAERAAHRAGLDVAQRARVDRARPRRRSVPRALAGLPDRPDRSGHRTTVDRRAGDRGSARLVAAGRDVRGPAGRSPPARRRPGVRGRRGAQRGRPRPSGRRPRRRDRTGRPLQFQRYGRRDRPGGARRPRRVAARTHRRREVVGRPPRRTRTARSCSPGSAEACCCDVCWPRSARTTRRRGKPSTRPAARCRSSRPV